MSTDAYERDVLAEIIEDVAESPAPPAPPVSVVSPLSQEKEAYKRLGLTKQVLAAHTQKEEQAFLNRCREHCKARTFQKDYSSHLHRQKRPVNPEGKQAFLNNHITLFTLITEAALLGIRRTDVEFKYGPFSSYS